MVSKSAASSVLQCDFARVMVLLLLLDLKYEQRLKNTGYLSLATTLIPTLLTFFGNVKKS